MSYFGSRYFASHYWAPVYWGTTGGSYLEVYHETRKALEARLVAATGLATLTVSWPNRPVTPPASAPWLRVHPIRWRNAGPATIGGTATRWAERRGEFVVDVIGRQDDGYGALNDIADAVRDQFMRTELTTATGMRLWVLAPGGPQRREERGFALVSVRVPFIVVETVTN